MAKMLANRVVLNALLKKNSPGTFVQKANVFAIAPSDSHDERQAIGKREWVGYGINSMPNYADRPDIPFPAVRFKEITGELVALREKEKGDWKKLTMEEKKKLYRASFRQTLAEVNAPTGRWKSILGFTLIFISVGMWLFILEKLYVYKPKPKTFTDEWRAAALRRQIDLQVNHLTGIPSRWDYEKNDWKK